MAVPAKSVLVLNGRIYAGKSDGRPCVSCVDVVAYTPPGGERRTSLFPKKGSDGAAEFPQQYVVPDPESGTWISGFDLLRPEKAKHHGRVPPEILDAMPEGYGLRKPSVVSAEMGEERLLELWFPICADIEPGPLHADVAFYAGNGAQDRWLHDWLIRYSAGGGTRQKSAWTRQTSTSIRTSGISP